MSDRVRAALVFVALAAVVVSAACGGRIFGRQFEYEEDLYLSTDGSADLIVNASIPSLVALRGLQLNIDPSTQVDTAAIRAAYTSPVTQVSRVSRWRRSGRRFVQVRVRVTDIRKLPTVGPFSWSRYELLERGGERVFIQSVGPSAFVPGSLRNVGWTGGELVAFRVHLPSAITWHNARDIETGKESDVQRGNILEWQQLLTDRLDSRPVNIEIRMHLESILHRTLWVFAGAFAAAVLLIVVLIWLTVRKGAKQAAAAP